MERARWTCLFYYWPNANLYVPTETFGEPLPVGAYESQYIKWYLDFEWLFSPFQKRSIVWIACVCDRKEWTDSSQRDHIFPNHRFVIIAIFWMTQYNGFHVIDLHEDEHWVYGTRVIPQNFVTQQIKVLTLRLLLSLFRFSFYSVWRIKKERAPHWNWEIFVECESQQRKVFAKQFSSWILSCMPNVHRA